MSQATARRRVAAEVDASSGRLPRVCRMPSVWKTALHPCSRRGRWGSALVWCTPADVQFLFWAWGRGSCSPFARNAQVIEGQLTWLVYIVGAVIRGRLSSSSAESQETIDGDLAARVFGLLQLCDAGFHTRRYEEHTRQRLDIALLSFFQNFRKVRAPTGMCKMAMGQRAFASHG